MGATGANTGARAFGPVPAQGDPQEQRPFELVRYFSVTSLVIILLFTFIISTILSRRASEATITRKEQYALLLAENLNHQVITRFVIPTIAEKGGINVGQPEQFKLLDAVVRNSIESFKVSRVNILDLEGNVIYSTEPWYIGRVSADWKGFQAAASGGHGAVLSPPRGLFEVGAGPQRVLKIFIPLRDERRRTAELGPPRAVFAIILDMTNDFRAVWLDQMLVVASLMVMMALLFIILRSIVTRGQRIMDRKAATEARLKEQLNQSERLAALGRMIAGVAHEIRNPLGIVRSTAELLGSKAEPSQKALAGVIVEESTRLNRIVTEFLDFARPQQPTLKPITIEEVLSHNLHVLEPEAERLGVKVDRRYATGAVKLMGDADHLYRAFLNIFNNALQAMEEKGGHMAVSTRTATEGGRLWVVATVEDDGPGFEPDITGQLLDPFFTTKERGTGLGLSIVSSIITSHNGRMQLGESNMGGARVEIWLPASGE